jgi:hypothetical protein
VPKTAIILGGGVTNLIVPNVVSTMPEPTVDEVVELLEREGVRKFTDAWTLLLRHLEESLTAAAARRTAGPRLRASCESDQ